MGRSAAARRGASSTGRSRRTRRCRVHTAWGRTLKDVFQRYKALRGFDQRYQNGFDCQGLWIEVEVEKSLGLNSKREIEEYGLDRFARECTAVVEHYIGELTRGSIRLGQWMDWGNDYADVLGHEHRVHLAVPRARPRAGLALPRPPLDRLVPALWHVALPARASQSGVYQERADPSLYVRLPLVERRGESIVVWTTTPWTLPANVAAGVRPGAEYGLTDEGNWVAVERYPDERFTDRLRGEELVGLHYEGPFDTLEPGRPSSTVSSRGRT